MARQMADFENEPNDPWSTTPTAAAGGDGSSGEVPSNLFDHPQASVSPRAAVESEHRRRPRRNPRIRTPRLSAAGRAEDFRRLLGGIRLPQPHASFGRRRARHCRRRRGPRTRRVPGHLVAAGSVVAVVCAGAFVLGSDDKDRDTAATLVATSPEHHAHRSPTRSADTESLTKNEPENRAASDRGKPNRTARDASARRAAGRPRHPGDRPGGQGAEPEPAAAPVESSVPASGPTPAPAATAPSPEPQPSAADAAASEFGIEG